MRTNAVTLSELRPVTLPPSRSAVYPVHPAREGANSARAAAAAGSTMATTPRGTTVSSSGATAAPSPATITAVPSIPLSSITGPASGRASGAATTAAASASALTRRSGSGSTPRGTATSTVTPPSRPVLLPKLPLSPRMTRPAVSPRLSPSLLAATPPSSASAPPTHLVAPSTCFFDLASRKDFDGQFRCATTVTVHTAACQTKHSIPTHPVHSTAAAAASSTTKKKSASPEREGVDGGKATSARRPSKEKSEEQKEDGNGTSAGRDGSPARVGSASDSHAPHPHPSSGLTPPPSPPPSHLTSSAEDASSPAAAPAEGQEDWSRKTATTPRRGTPRKLRRTGSGNSSLAGSLRAASATSSGRAGGGGGGGGGGHRFHLHRRTSSSVSASTPGPSPAAGAATQPGSARGPNTTGNRGRRYDQDRQNTRLDMPKLYASGLHHSLWVASQDGTIEVRSKASPDVLMAVIPKKTSRVVITSLTQLGDNRVVAGQSDGTLRVFDAVTHEEIREIRAHAAAITCMAVTVMPTAQIEEEDPTAAGGGGGAVASYPRATVLLTGSLDWTIGKWDGLTLQCLGRLQGGSRGIGSLAASLGGCHAFSGGEDGALRMWNLLDNTQLGLSKEEKEVLQLTTGVVGVASKSPRVSTGDAGRLMEEEQLTSSVKGGRYSSTPTRSAKPAGGAIALTQGTTATATKDDAPLGTPRSRQATANASPGAAPAIPLVPPLALARPIKLNKPKGKKAATASTAREEASAERGEDYHTPPRQSTGATGAAAVTPTTGTAVPTSRVPHLNLAVKGVNGSGGGSGVLAPRSAPLHTEADDAAGASMTPSRTHRRRTALRAQSPVPSTTTPHTATAGRAKTPMTSRVSYDGPKLLLHPYRATADSTAHRRSRSLDDGPGGMLAGFGTDISPVRSRAAKAGHGGGDGSDSEASVGRAAAARGATTPGRASRTPRRTAPGGENHDAVGGDEKPKKLRLKRRSRDLAVAVMRRVETALCTFRRSAPPTKLSAELTVHLQLNTYADPNMVYWPIEHAHRDSVTAMAVVDDCLLVSASRDASAKVFALPTGALVRTLHSQKKMPVSAVMVDHAQRRVLLGSTDGTIAAFDLRTPELAPVLHVSSTVSFSTVYVPIAEYTMRRFFFLSHHHTDPSEPATGLRTPTPSLSNRSSPPIAHSPLPSGRRMSASRRGSQPATEDAAAAEELEGPREPALCVLGVAQMDRTTHAHGANHTVSTYRVGEPSLREFGQSTTIAKMQQKCLEAAIIKARVRTMGTVEEMELADVQKCGLVLETWHVRQLVLRYFMMWQRCGRRRAERAKRWNEVAYRGALVDTVVARRAWCKWVDYCRVQENHRWEAKRVTLEIRGTTEDPRRQADNANSGAAEGFSFDLVRRDARRVGAHLATYVHRLNTLQTLRRLFLQWMRHAAQRHTKDRRELAYNRLLLSMSGPSYDSAEVVWEALTEYAVRKTRLAHATWLMTQNAEWKAQAVRRSYFATWRRAVDRARRAEAEASQWQLVELLSSKLVRPEVLRRQCFFKWRDFAVNVSSERRLSEENKTLQREWKALQHTIDNPSSFAQLKAEEFELETAIARTAYERETAHLQEKSLTQEKNALEVTDALRVLLTGFQSSTASLAGGGVSMAAVVSSTDGFATGMPTASPLLRSSSSASSPLVGRSPLRARVQGNVRVGGRLGTPGGAGGNSLSVSAAGAASLDPREVDDSVSAASSGGEPNPVYLLQQLGAVLRALKGTALQCQRDEKLMLTAQLLAQRLHLLDSSVTGGAAILASADLGAAGLTSSTNFGDLGASYNSMASVNSGTVRSTGSGNVLMGSTGGAGGATSTSTPRGTAGGPRTRSGSWSVTAAGGANSSSAGAARKASVATSVPAGCVRTPRAMGLGSGVVASATNSSGVSPAAMWSATGKEVNYHSLAEAFDAQVVLLCVLLHTAAAEAGADLDASVRPPVVSHAARATASHTPGSLMSGGLLGSQGAVPSGTPPSPTPAPTSRSVSGSSLRYSPPIVAAAVPPPAVVEAASHSQSSAALQWLSRVPMRIRRELVSTVVKLVAMYDSFVAHSEMPLEDTVAGISTRGATYTAPLPLSYLCSERAAQQVLRYAAVLLELLQPQLWERQQQLNALYDQYAATASPFTGSFTAGSGGGAAGSVGGGEGGAASVDAADGGREASPQPFMQLPLPLSAVRQQQQQQPPQRRMTTTSVPTPTPYKDPSPRAPHPARSGSVTSGASTAAARRASAGVRSRAATAATEAAAAAAAADSATAMMSTSYVVEEDDEMRESYSPRPFSGVSTPRSVSLMLTPRSASAAVGQGGHPLGRPYLGFRVNVGRDTQTGRVVISIKEVATTYVNVSGDEVPGPALVAGLKVGDQLVRFAGYAVTDLPSFNAVVSRHVRPDVTLPVVVARNGEFVDATIHVGLKPHSA